MIVLINRIRARYAPAGSFKANALTLMTGATIAQAIPIAVSPILTRIYKPEDFGVFALFMSTAGLLSIIATGRYEMAVMLPESDEDSVNVVALSLLIACFVSLISLIGVFVFNSAIADLLGNKDISVWLYFIPMTVLLTGVYNTLTCWSNRKKRYNRLAVSRMSQAGASAVAQLGMGFGGGTTGGLVGGSIIGQGVATGVLGWRIWRGDKDKKDLISKGLILTNARKYDVFPKINSLHAFVDVLQSSGMVFLLSYFFGGVILGFYSLTLKVLRTPVSLIGTSVSQVFFQKASETYNTGGDLELLVKRMIVRLSLLASPLFIIIFLFGPDMFSIFFGETWRAAGIYARILAPWLYVNFIFSPVSQIPIIVRRQGVGFWAGFFYQLITITTVFVSGYLNKGIESTLIFFSLIATIASLLYGVVLIKLSKARDISADL